MTNWQIDAFLAQLRRLWPDVHETAGWRTRANAGGRGQFVAGGPIGIMSHHTASNPFEAPGPAVNRIITGWSGLPGPVYNVMVVTSGAVHLVAAGPANHAGQGVGRVRDRTRQGLPPLGDANAVYGNRSDTMSGNTWYFSVGAQHRGADPHWPTRQIDAVIAVNAAWHLARGTTAARSIHHREWTARRIDMSWRGDLRARTAALMAGNTPPPPPPAPPPPAGIQEDEMIIVSAPRNGQRVLGLLTGSGIRWIDATTTLNELRAANIPTIRVSGRWWNVNRAPGTTMTADDTNTP